MSPFAKIMKALHRSRRLQAEAVIRRHAHLVREAHQHECREQQAAAKAGRRPPLALVHSMLPACVAAGLAIAATALVNTASTAGDAGFATACALREIPVITAIEDSGADPTMSQDRVAYASFKMLAARRACYEGRVDAALRLYDEILNIELAKTGK